MPSTNAHKSIDDSSKYSPARVLTERYPILRQPVVSVRGGGVFAHTLHTLRCATVVSRGRKQNSVPPESRSTGAVRHRGYGSDSGRRFVVLCAMTIIGFVFEYTAFVLRAQQF